MLNLVIQDFKTNQKLISEEDDYIRHVTPEYIAQFTLDKSTAQQSFQETLKNSVVEAPRRFYHVLSECEDYINQALELLGVELHMTMNIIPTDGSDNIGLPYTKGTSLIMPVNYHYPPGPLSHLNPELVAHELWHILSRHNPELRKSAYKAFDFHEAPESLKPLETSGLLRRYFINPDAISHDHYFPLTLTDGKVYYGFPMLLSPNITPSIVVFDEQQNLYDIWGTHKVRQYNQHFPNISYNTHPEEICAEHFRLLMKDCHTPIRSKLVEPERIEQLADVVRNFFRT